jgi:peptidoglycan/xylan/chitin deacetylase (PgdA/CDA1 family)
MLRSKPRFSYLSYIMFFAITTISFIIFFSLFNKTFGVLTHTSAQNRPFLNCKCAIFRLDDIEDNSKSKVETAILGHFIDKGKKLVTAIIVNRFGNLASDGTVYAKVKEGYDKGLFQLAIHGWNHVRYSNLTEEQQKQDIINSNNKLLSLFGNKSRIFAPPFNAFDSDTIEAVAESGLNIFSASVDEEAKTINPYKLSTLLTTNNSKLGLSEVNATSSDGRLPLMKEIYHIPFSTSLLDLMRRGYSGQNLIERILSDVNRNIASQGFSVINLHPTDFATFNASSGSYRNEVDPFKFQNLVNLFDRLEAANIRIANFADITRPDNSRNMK